MSNEANAYGPAYAPAVKIGLPPLPEADVLALSDYTCDDGSRQSDAFSFDLIRAYGEACYQAGLDQAKAIA
jgi:hypothetical protein